MSKGKKQNIQTNGKNIAIYSLKALVIKPFNLYFFSNRFIIKGKIENNSREKSGVSALVVKNQAVPTIAVFRNSLLNCKMNFPRCKINQIQIFVKISGMAYISTFFVIFESNIRLNLYFKFNLYNKIISIKATAKVIATRIAEAFEIMFENAKNNPKSANW